MQSELSLNVGDLVAFSQDSKHEAHGCVWHPPREVPKLSVWRPAFDLISCLHLSRFLLTRVLVGSILGKKCMCLFPCVFGCMCFLVFRWRSVCFASFCFCFPGRVGAYICNI